MSQILYKKTQNGVIINFIIQFSAILLIILARKSDNPTETAILIVIAVLLFLAWLLVYKLTIVIDDKTITAIFGIGLLKRKFNISDIDFSTLQVVKPSLLAGIGIRLTSKGWLWNVKVGKAIYFKSKNGKTFFVGTDEPEKIIEILKSISTDRSN
jgi:hypothetical protein